MKREIRNVSHRMTKTVDRLRGLLVIAVCFHGCTSETLQVGKATLEPGPGDHVVRVGPAEVVLATKDKPYSWPDGTIGIMREGDAYSFIAAGPGTPIRTVGSLENPVAKGVQVQEIAGIKHGYPYAAGGRIYKDPDTGILLLFYHAEIWTFPPGYIPFFSELGLAFSKDGGISWDDLGPIVRPHTPVSAPYFEKGGTWDVGWGTYALAGEYFYLYFADLIDDGGSYKRANLAVARAKISEVIDAAVIRHQTSPWIKYYRGTWGEPGLGGKSSALVEHDQVNDSFMPSDVVFNTCARKYMAILLGEPFPNSDLYWSESTDGLKWTPIRKLIGDEGEQIYATFVGMGKDPHLPGNEFFIYYIDSKNGGNVGDRNQDAALMRRRVSLLNARCDEAS